MYDQDIDRTVVGVVGAAVTLQQEGLRFDTENCEKWSLLCMYSHCQQRLLSRYSGFLAQTNTYTLG